MTKTSLLLAAVVAVSLGAFTSVQAKSELTNSDRNELTQNQQDAAPTIATLDSSTPQAK